MLLNTKSSKSFLLDWGVKVDPVTGNRPNEDWPSVDIKLVTGSVGVTLNVISSLAVGLDTESFSHKYWLCINLFSSAELPNVICTTVSKLVAGQDGVISYEAVPDGVIVTVAVVD